MGHSKSKQHLNDTASSLCHIESPLGFKVATSPFPHLEKFSLNLPSSLSVIRVILTILVPLWFIIIKFPYNARSDWLKQRALSEKRARVDGSKLASKFLLRNFDKFDPN